jgi:succinoglycan biosynthesis protein ExoM
VPEEDGGSPADVAICVTTYLRPLGLERLVGHLQRLRVPDGVRARVVVVDNDPAGSAEAVVRRLAPDSVLPIEYAHESARGISQARNRAVREAAGSRWIAFVDDDDWPDPGWLESLIDTQRRTGADAVVGPAIAEFEMAPPPWMPVEPYGDDPGRAIGAPLEYWQVRTGGVLLLTSSVAALGDDPFDVRLGLVGGEDTALFWRLAAAGRRFVWDERAVIHLWVPASKARARWLLARAFRTGNSRGSLLVDQVDDRWLRRARRVAGSGLQVVLALGSLVTVRSRAAAFRALLRITDRLGDACGALGYRHREYGRVHGA